MKKLIHFIFLLLFTNLIHAQSPGLVIRPQGGGTVTLLNPNGDSWSSTSTSGFINNDSTESEIPFKGVPTVMTETTGDIAQGPTGGFSDLVKPTPGYSFYVYSDGTNLYFRMRLGGIVSGAKGYSILIDADSKFGATGADADPNYVAATTNVNGNAGFEWEVVFETTKRVAIYSVDGSSTPILANSYSIATNSQVSVALSTISNNPDYFYDFVVPIAGFAGYSPVITASTPLRFAATTVMSPNPATGGNKSDIYGGTNYTTIINQTVPVTPTQINTSTIPPIRTAAPVLTTPINSGTVTVQGTWTRTDPSNAASATINLYKNGVLVGTTTVSSGGTWSIPGITSAVGDVFYTTAQGSGESVSPASNYYTVIGCSTATTTTTTGLDFTCSSTRGMMGNRPLNAAVILYTTTSSGISVFRTDASSPYAITYPTTTTWRYDDVNTQSGSACTGGAADITAAQFSITATQSGLCQSAQVYTTGCSLGSTTATPVLTQTTLYQGNTTVSGTCTSGATVRYYKNSVLISSQTAVGTTYSFTNISLSGGDVITVTAQTTGTCMSAAASRTVVVYTNPPVINTSTSGTLIAGATTITGTSVEAVGTVIRVYQNGVLLGTTTVLANGTWSLTATVMAGSTYYATAQASGAAVSVASPTVSVQTGTTIVPVITGSYTENATSVSGTLPLTLTGKVYLYLDGIKIDSVSVVAGMAWSIPVNTTTGNAIYAGGVLTTTVQSTGSAENSTTSNAVTVSCAIPTTPAITPSTTAVCIGSTVTFTISSSQNGILYSIRDNSDAANLGLSKFGNGGSLTLTTSALNTASTFTARVKATSFSGASCESYSTASLTVDAASVGGSVSSNATVCTGTNNTALTLGSNTGSIVKWQLSTDNFSSVITDISNTTTGLTATNLTASTQYRAVIKSGACASTNSAIAVITVDAATISGSIAGYGRVCTGSNSTALTLGSNNGTIVKWQSSTDNFSSVITDISNTTTSLTATNLSANTQYRALLQNGTCTAAYTSAVEITTVGSGSWKGTSTGDWNTAANWCGGVPTISSNVSIPAGVTVTISGADALANYVNIASGASLTLSGATNITIAAGGTFTNNGSFDASASTTGKIIFAGAATISGTTTFKNIDANGALDFGTASTVSGTFTLQSGGSVTGHSPFYSCPSSTLSYNTNSTFLRGIEWTTSSSGAGYPANVTVNGNTTINFPAIGNGYICNDLTIENGSSLRQDYSGGSAILNVGRNVTINGILSLGGASGGDIYLGGSWTRNTGGTFNHNNRKVTFEGTSNFSGNGTVMSTITAPASAAKDNEGGFGGEKFAHLWINKTTAADSVVLLSNITVTKEIGFTKGTFSLRNSDVTIVSNSSRTADVAPVYNIANINIRYAGTGKFYIQRFIQNPTGTRSWRLLTAPLQAASAPSINAAWQEAVVNPDKNNPNGNAGIYNPWTGYGTHITGPGGTYNAANGFDQGTNSSSILYANAGVTAWATPSSTTSIKITDQQGWMLFVRGDRSFVIGGPYVSSQNSTLEAKGKINTGDILVPVSAGKQVIANPYASAISLLNVDVAGTAGNSSTYYMWDPKMFTSYTQPGKWVTFTGVGSYFVQTTSESPYTSDGTIESGLAFVIDAAIPGNITFHESDKKPLSSSLTGISNATGARPMSLVPMFRTDIYATNGSNYTLTDGVLNIFDGSFSNAADAGDAKKFINFNTKESLSILRDSVKLAIEKRRDIQTADTIFYSMSKFNAMPYQFRFMAADFTTGMEAWLEDNYAGTRMPVSTAGATNINFSITSDSLSKVANRFRVIFKMPGIVLPVTFTGPQAWQQNNDIAVQWKVANELNIKEYSVQKSIDAIHFEKVNSTNCPGNYSGSRIYNWLDKNITDSVNYYRIESKGTDEALNYSAVVKVTLPAAKGSINIYPNPVLDGMIKLHFSAMPKGTYYIKLINAVGQPELVTKVAYTGGTVIKEITVGNSFVKGVYHLEVTNDMGLERKIEKVIFK